MCRTDEILEYLYPEHPVKYLDYVPDSNFQKEVYALRQYAVYPNIGKNLAYATLGLIGEYSEVAQKFVDCDVEGAVAEYMDVLWYLNQFCYEVACAIERPGFGLDAIEAAAGYVLDINDAEGHVWAQLLMDDELVIHTGALAELAKKNVRDGFEILERKQHDIAKTVYMLAVDVFASVMHNGIKPAKLVKMLHDKLSDRRTRGVLHGSGDYR